MKKVTLKMVKEFAKISEDYNPIHLDKILRKNQDIKVRSHTA